MVFMFFFFFMSPHQKNLGYVLTLLLADNFLSLESGWIIFRKFVNRAYVQTSQSYMKTSEI